MLDGQPPYFNLFAKEAMACLLDQDPPMPKHPEKVRHNQEYIVAKKFFIGFFFVLDVT